MFFHQKSEQKQFLSEQTESYQKILTVLVVTSVLLDEMLLFYFFK